MSQISSIVQNFTGASKITIFDSITQWTHRTIQVLRGQIAQNPHAAIGAIVAINTLFFMAICVLVEKINREDAQTDRSQRIFKSIASNGVVGSAGVGFNLLLSKLGAYQLKLTYLAAIFAAFVIARLAINAICHPSKEEMTIIKDLSVNQHVEKQSQIKKDKKQPVIDFLKLEEKQNENESFPTFTSEEPNATENESPPQSFISSKEKEENVPNEDKKDLTQTAGSVEGNPSSEETFEAQNTLQTNEGTNELTEEQKQSNTKDPSSSESDAQQDDKYKTSDSTSTTPNSGQNQDVGVNHEGLATQDTESNLNGKTNSDTSKSDSSDKTTLFIKDFHTIIPPVDTQEIKIETIDLLELKPDDTALDTSKPKNETEIKSDTTEDPSKSNSETEEKTVVENDKKNDDEINDEALYPTVSEFVSDVAKDTWKATKQSFWGMFYKN